MVSNVGALYRTGCVVGDRDACLFWDGAVRCIPALILRRRGGGVEGWGQLDAGWQERRERGGEDSQGLLMGRSEGGVRCHRGGFNHTGGVTELLPAHRSVHREG